MSILDTKIEFLKGVGPKRSLLLNQELSIFSFWDLLNFFPYRHVDRSKFHTINQIQSFDVDVQIIGYVKSKKNIGVGKKKRLVVHFYDKTGVVQLTFFKRIKWISDFLKIGGRYLVFGKPSKYGNVLSFVHPEIENMELSKKLPSYALYPVYHSTEKLTSNGLNSKGLSKLMQSLLTLLNQDIIENMSLEIIEKFKFSTRHQAFCEMHFPSNLNKMNQSIFR